MQGVYFQNFTVFVMNSYVPKSFSSYLFPAIIIIFTSN